MENRGSDSRRSCSHGSYGLAAQRSVGSLSCICAEAAPEGPALAAAGCAPARNKELEAGTYGEMFSLDGGAGHIHLKGQLLLHAMQLEVVALADRSLQHHALQIAGLSYTAAG